ncbi:MAG: hypothetical protein M8860_08595 [marine benthic group bacterium]|jgi:hypothetical protein|nr:hypothetical protein [Gemmatimonadota bacterium]MCL7962892.1 hypothetical protein [Candidatus Carthagonibacter metallireducens]MCL7963904.1 hypothetical protein [Gemmatimonadota bacterium]MCL7967163.1 hypothetical protein [Gemmatimonadota bacterium]MCL7969230.1 hypothetical protein [Gemmatimonadota bacterium]
MSSRIHIVVDESEKEQFVRRAREEGKNLSQWLRDVARQALLRGDGGPKLTSVDQLRSFFARCDERESGREPDWDEHRRIIEQSVARGAGGA